MDMLTMKKFLKYSSIVILIVLANFAKAQELTHSIAIEVSSLKKSNLHDNFYIEKYSNNHNFGYHTFRKYIPAMNYRLDYKHFSFGMFYQHGGTTLLQSERELRLLQPGELIYYINNNLGMSLGINYKISYFDQQIGLELGFKF